MKRALSIGTMCLMMVVGLAVAGDDAGAERDLSAEAFTGLALRSIGPALMSGRIAHIAFHPEDPNTWYVAVGSGGAWVAAGAWVACWAAGPPKPRKSCMPG